MAQKKGFISRLIEGPERSETYARSTLPGNRWELGWDTFRNNMGKMIGLNLLMLAFFLPVIAVIVFRYVFVSFYASSLPFSQNIGLGYPAIPSTVGISEQIYLLVDRSVFIFLPLASIIASVGLSGGMYVMRNMVWAEGVFVGSDFWRGVKKNFFIVLLCTLAYSLIFLLCILSIDYATFASTVSDKVWILSISKVMSYLMIGFFTIAYFFALTMGVTYELKFFKLIKNSFIMTIGLLPLNIFFALLSLLIIIFTLVGGILMSFALMFFILFGFSVFALIWTTYSHWTFDRFINDKVAGAIKNRGIYSKKATEEQADFNFESSTLGKRPIKPITDTDVEIAVLPTNFSRADLEKLEQSKQAMRENSDEYVTKMLDEISKNANTENETDNADKDDKQLVDEFMGESENDKDKDTQN